MQLKIDIFGPCNSKIFVPVSCTCRLAPFTNQALQVMPYLLCIMSKLCILAT